MTARPPAGLSWRRSDPPDALASALAIGSPSPVPGSEWSNRQNRSSARAFSSSLRPGPSSAMVNRWSVRPRTTPTKTGPFGDVKSSATSATSAMADRVDTWSAIADVADVALDFTSPNGPVFVGVVRGRTDHRLTIADEGPGLSDELKARALDRFWRFDHSEPGTGLGLPIANALAKASGGSLLLHDSPSGGLAASVTLPAAGSKP